MNLEATCLICKKGGGGGVTPTGKKPRDRKQADIVVCVECGHIQMFPLLTKEEEKSEYDNDYSLRFGKVKIGDGPDFESMRVKFAQWAKAHADLYFDDLQKHKQVLDLGAGYGFFMENLNNRPNRNFDIEGIEIGQFRIDNFAGGIVHNINLLSDEIPKHLHHKYDCIVSIHLLEHISRPVEFLEKTKLLLKQSNQSYVLFEVPNINCWLGEISPEYKDFMYFSEHCSYYSADTLKLVFEKAGYAIESINTYEIYSLENHLHWLSEGVPFTKYSQMFMQNENMEWINEIYKKELGKKGKGFSLVIKARPL